MSTREGFVWTPSAGLQAGLPTPSKIDPSTRKLPNHGDVADVIILGAGYAGLVAARDLATQGQNVLLVEARDRIGGRTWHSSINGFNYEMGGTWIHWQMPHIYREVSLYGLQDDWIVSQVQGGKEDYCTIAIDGEKVNISHDEEVSIFSKTWKTFCDIDGAGLKEIMPYPLGSKMHEEEMAHWDKLSCRDRLNEIKHQFTKKEIAVLEAIILQMGGGPLEDMAFTDSMRWYALGGWTPTGMNDIALTTRLRSGQSTLAKCIFDHAVSTERLAYSFSSPVQSIIEEGGIVNVVLRAGKVFKAQRVICTIPLNVLSDITFSPPLNALKTEAINIGQVNRNNKIHADIAGNDLVSWTSVASPGKGMICAIADHVTPAGDTHLVLFGPKPDSNAGIHLQDGIQSVKTAVEHLLPLKSNSITRIVYHDWYADEFAKGTWCYYAPNFVTKYLDVLRERHGRVHFAGADWSYGWRGWIDGAVEQGASVAMTVQKELRATKVVPAESTFGTIATRL